MKQTTIATIQGIPIYRRELQKLPANHSLSSRARALRKAGVFSEVVFWLQVHKGKFHQIDFDRQRVIGNYIVDFYIKSLGSVIEIDGTSHNNREEYDNYRNKSLQSFGLFIYRIPDIRIKHDLSNVMNELEHFIINRFSNSPPPEGCPKGGVDFW